MSKKTGNGDVLRCSFCNKSQRDVKKLIAGPTVYICDECVDICLDIIAEEREPDEPKAKVKLPKPVEIREFLDEVFSHLGLDWRKYVEQDPRFFRPSEVDALCGDATKARNKLGWQPKVFFRELCQMMVDADLELAQREATR